MLYTRPEVVLQMAVVPEMAPADGALLVMVMVLVEDELLLPQSLVAVTVTWPVVVPAFTSIVVVPWPPVIVQPCGTDQV